MKLTVEAIPTPKGFVHPPAKYDALPRHEFSMGLIAPKGSGKTTVLCNLLKFYKGYFHSILVFSPTVASDEKWDW
jgi:Ni2+-binding GTPase involved in maturation of urease and hydrogenase